MKLSGKTIYLTPWTKKDAPALQEMCNDKSIAYFTRVPFPYTLKHAEEFIEKSKKSWKKRKVFFFAVKLKKNNLLVGSVHIRLNKKHKRAEIGYLVHRNFRRKGIAFQAGKLALKFAFKKLKLHRIEIYCAETNTASKKTIEKLGAKFEGIQRDKIFKHGKFHNRLSYSILKNEFAEQPAKLSRVPKAP